MAAYISVPRDFSKVKSKVAFNLTARQLICFGAAAVVGVPLFFVLRDTAGNSGATLGMMAVMLPMFFLAMYQKNGQPAEKILRYYFQARFVRPKVRPYHSDYSVMDGGQLGAPELTIQEAREQILEAHHMEKGRRLLQDYDAVMDKVAEAEELSADHRPSTLEKLAELASDTSAPKSSARSAPEL